MIVNILRASQYQTHRGVVEVPTKNESSVRAIMVPSFVMELLRQYHVWWNEQQAIYGKDWQGKEQRLFIQDNGKPINPELEPSSMPTESSKYSNSNPGNFPMHSDVESSQNTVAIELMRFTINQLNDTYREYEVLQKPAPGCSGVITYKSLPGYFYRNRFQ